MDEVARILEAVGLPYAYDHFAEGDSPEPPFICYLAPYSDNFAADGRVYFRATEVHVELYTDAKDPASERRVESALDARGLFWEREEAWIESERLYESIYTFEIKEG